MKSLILARQYTDKETMGLFTIMEDMNSLFTCKCLELPWLNNQQNISCIPGGSIYNVEKYSATGHPNVFWIKDVPGRTGILIHSGDFATGVKIDTLGCLLAGMAFIDIDGNGILDVVRPDIAMSALNYFLSSKFKLHIL